jgi:hypothetical protein
MVYPFYSMDIFFQDSNEIGLPLEEVRLIEVKVTPQANIGRVKIHLKLTPFMKGPNVSVTISDASGKDVAHTSILETMLPKLEFTMHMLEPVQSSEYSVEISVYYQPMPEPSENRVDIQLPDPKVVDRYKATFTFPQLEP